MVQQVVLHYHLITSTVRGLFSAGGDPSYNKSTGEFSSTNDAGDIESVTAGTGLTGGGPKWCSKFSTYHLGLESLSIQMTIEFYSGR